MIGPRLRVPPVPPAPTRFRWVSKTSCRLLAQPSAVCHGIIPSHGDDRLLWIRKDRIQNKRRRLFLRYIEKFFVLAIGDRKSADAETIHPDTVAGLFIFLTLYRTHEKPAVGDGYNIGSDHRVNLRLWQKSCQTRFSDPMLLMCHYERRLCENSCSGQFVVSNASERSKKKISRLRLEMTTLHTVFHVPLV